MNWLTKLLGIGTGVFAVLLLWFIFMSIGTTINYFVFNFILSVFNFDFQLTWLQTFCITFLLGYFTRK